MRALIIFLLIATNTFSQEIDENKYYAEIRTVLLKSNIFEKERELQIYLPDEYFKDSNKKFKVVYLFDAQNQRIFNFVKGNVELLAMNFIEPLIIVGIVTEDRWFEFLPENNNVEEPGKIEAAKWIEKPSLKFSPSPIKLKGVSAKFSK